MLPLVNATAIRHWDPSSAVIFIIGMRFVSLIFMAGLAASVAAQSTRRVLGFEVDGAYAYFGSSAIKDNIMDKERGNALALSAAVMWRDSVRTGWDGISIGAGSGIFWWDEEILVPVFLQFEFKPWAQAKPFFLIRPERIAFNVRAGGVFGAWKETTTGQLSGGLCSYLGLRYALGYSKKPSTWLEIGSGFFGMRGSYAVESGGVWKEKDPDFLYVQVALGVAW